MTNSTDLFDGVHSALAFKAPCLVSSDTNITLSGLQTVGGTAARTRVTARENPTNNVGLIWVDNFTTTQFTINVENDPGASGLDVSWNVHP